jgi:hypothetical protein
MATEGHERGPREDCQQKRKAEIDEELSEIRAQMEKLAFKMQQDAKVHWVYEWPMKKKVKWPVKKLLARGQQRLLRMWLRYVKSLRGEEEMVHICEPEAGRNLSDDEEKRSEKGLRNCQVSSEESSDFQVGNEMGSLEDLIDCQMGRTKIPDFQVGKGEEMRLSDSLMNSEVSLDQQGEMMEEDQKYILIIGGIEVFLPDSPVKATTHVAGAATGEGQPTMTCHKGRRACR